MRRRLFVLFTSLLLSACMPPLSAEQARATAVAGGCWPYGSDQPVTPVPTTPVRALTPTPSPQPTVVAYRACTPLPNTPTATMRPTRVPTPAPRPTPPPPALNGGREVIGQQPGSATAWARSTRTPSLAIRPQDGRAAVAWLSWGGGPDVYAGDVWVRVQGENRRWMDSQTLNRAPVKSFFGGLGATWTVSDTIAVAYGGGNFDGDTRIYVATSSDEGASWGVPENTGLRGRVMSLKSDGTGTIYLLALVEGTSDGQTGYPIVARRVPGGAWQVSPHLVQHRYYSGDLALVDRANQAPQVYAILTDASGGPGTPRSAVTLAASYNGGDTWQAHDLSDTNHVGAGMVIATSVTAGQRPDGGIVVAAAWSQTPGPGPVAGAVQARISLDGGVSWGDVETIAQHDSQARFTDDQADPAYLGGFEPALAYDSATDRLAASWIEDDLSRRDTRDSSSSNRSVRTLLAARRLDTGAAWEFAVTPSGAPDAPPLLTSWGLRGALWGSSDGHWQWLTIIDERNFQARIVAQPVSLTAVLAQGVP